jgi:tetratricopeptide (TPR) repeat protein
MKRTLHAAILFAVIILLASIADAAVKGGNPQAAFYKGNTFYEHGDYEAALDAYNDVLSMGKESGPLYYNMGNCYFRLGKTGMAILYYERARRLMPRDSDLKANYRFALSQTGAPSYSPSTIRRIIERSKVLTVDEITICISAMFILILGLIIGTRLAAGLRRSLLAAIVAILIIALSLSFVLYLRISSIGSEAIIIAEKADAGFEPITSATVHYTLYEGAKVYIIEKKGEWTRVKRADGKSGWVRSALLQVI